MPTPAIGFFGKLPSAGDFVQRRLPAGFVDAWDNHFESAVAASRRALGGDWHDAYHASPVWRFLLAPGACGDSAWTGIMGPGTDRVGRCFPMVMATPAAIDMIPGAQALFDRDTWFQAVEQVYGAAQADAGISVDAFDAQVAALAAPMDASLLSAPESLHDIDWSASGHWRLSLPMHADTSFLGGLWQRLAMAPGPWCLWWTAGTTRVPARVLVTRGLPQPDAYAGFLDANAETAAWRSPGAAESPASRRHEPSDVSDLIGATSVFAPPVAAMPAAWLPDDPELFSDLTAGSQVAHAAPNAASAPIETAAHEPAASTAVLHRADTGSILVAASSAPPDPRQRAVAAVIGIGRDLPANEWAGGMHALRTQLMALNPPLQHAAEDLVDPVAEDCAVIAMRIAADRADLLRIGAATAWHWRQGNLQPVFAGAVGATAPSAGIDDDFDDLLFSRGQPTLPGLGAAAQPACDEAACALRDGDRVLLLATAPLMQLSPEVLVRSLAMPSRDDACLHLATAAGLGGGTGHWPIAIIEVGA